MVASFFTSSDSSTSPFFYISHNFLLFFHREGIISLFKLLHFPVIKAQVKKLIWKIQRQAFKAHTYTHCLPNTSVIATVWPGTGGAGMRRGSKPGLLRAGVQIQPGTAPARAKEAKGHIS